MVAVVISKASRLSRNGGALTHDLAIGTKDEIGAGLLEALSGRLSLVLPRLLECKPAQHECLGGPSGSNTLCAFRWPFASFPTGA
jgi:hypothetical protein